ncbi:MAG: putative sulfate exporter family transporter [Burkholderiales bacterium]
MLVTWMAWANDLSSSALTFAVLFGIIAGDTFLPAIAPATGAGGVDLSQNLLLLAGLVLFGLCITFQQVGQVGTGSVLIAVVMRGSTPCCSRWQWPRSGCARTSARFGRPV